MPAFSTDVDILLPSVGSLRNDANDAGINDTVCNDAVIARD